MADEGFDNNFTWYEWTFVSPERVPSDDLQVPVENDRPGYVRVRPADRDEDRRWAM